MIRTGIIFICILLSACAGGQQPQQQSSLSNSYSNDEAYDELSLSDNIDENEVANSPTFELQYEPELETAAGEAY